MIIETPVFCGRGEVASESQALTILSFSPQAYTGTHVSSHVRHVDLKGVVEGAPDRGSMSARTALCCHLSVLLARCTYLWEGDEPRQEDAKVLKDATASALGICGIVVAFLRLQCCGVARQSGDGALACLVGKISHI